MSLASLGYDFSGNGNHWFASNVSLTAGTTYDSMVDVPGIGSQVGKDTGGVMRSNYCTFNPLRTKTIIGGSYAAGTNLLNGNLTVYGDNVDASGTIQVKSGKWYYEGTLSAAVGNGSGFGWCAIDGPGASFSGTGGYAIIYRNTGDVMTGNGGTAPNRGDLTNPFGVSFVTGDIIGCALDADLSIAYWYKNGVLVGSLTLPASQEWTPMVACRSTGDYVHANFGQRPFSYSIPSGYKTLCTNNLPTPTIKRPEQHFELKNYTGNGKNLMVGSTAKESSNLQIKGLRLKRSATATLQKAFINSPTSRTTYTISAWVKPTLTGTNTIAVWGTPGNWESLRWYSDGTIYWCPGSGVTWQTNQSFISGQWYHVMVAVDTTQASPNNRGKLYINGVLITNYSTQSAVTQNAQTVEWGVPTADGSVIGATGGNGLANPFDGIISEFYYIDGSAKSPTDFGQFDANNNWVPKTYTGTYGNNGCYLPFNNTPSLGNSTYGVQWNNSTQYLRASNSTAFDIGSGTDYTFETWVYFGTTAGDGTVRYIFDATSTGASGGSQIFLAQETDGTWSVAGLSATAFPAGSFVTGKWYHVAVSRASGTVRTFIDGYLIASTSNTTSIDTDSITIGARYSNNYILHPGAILSNTRFVVGTGLYTANFTPPTTALTAVANTKLLTCQSSTIVDNSGNNYTITNTGSVAAPVIAYPFTGPSSVYSTVMSGTAYVTGTLPSSIGTGDFTVEMWMKPTSIANYNTIFATTRGTTGFNIGWGSDGMLTFYTNSNRQVTISTHKVVYNAWNHIAYVRSGSTITIYLNGVARASGTSQTWNLTATAFTIGCLDTLPTELAPGYYRDVRVTKQALYTGTFTPPTAPLTTTSQGATAGNVILLTCQDASIRDYSPSAITISKTNTSHTYNYAPPGYSNHNAGYDNSGNGNHWGVGGINAISGFDCDAGYDSITDFVDSNSNTNGNYSVLSSADVNGATIANGALQLQSIGTAAWRSARSTLSMTTGKWYAEFSPVINTTSSNCDVQLGVLLKNSILNGEFTGMQGIAFSAGDGNTYIDTAMQGTGYVGAFIYGDTIGIAYNADTGDVSCYKNGTLQKTTYVGTLKNVEAVFGVAAYSRGGGTISVNANFGQRPFAYTPPSGYTSVNSKNQKDVGSYNLPDTFGNVVNTPDLVWVKSRSTTDNHYLFDTVRGTNQRICSNLQVGQAYEDKLTSFIPNGFTYGPMSGGNQSGVTYNALMWNRGQVPGFDIVTYAGDSNNSRMIPHNLGQVPSFYITKNLDGYNNTNSYNDWNVYHKNNPIYNTNGKQAIYLHTSNIAGAAGGFYSNPTASHFGPNQTLYDNVSGHNYVAYLWAEVPGFSKFGFWNGNASADGPFLYTGFAPKFFMYKKVTAADSNQENWRSYYMPAGSYKVAQQSPATTAAESANSADLTFVSNGVKITSSWNGINSSDTYVYMAWAEAPFKYVNAR